MKVCSAVYINLVDMQTDLDPVARLVPEEWDFLWFVQEPGMFCVEYNLDLDQKHDLDLDLL